MSKSKKYTCNMLDSDYVTVKCLESDIAVRYHENGEFIGSILWTPEYAIEFAKDLIKQAQAVQEGDK